MRGESHRRAATVSSAPIDRARHLERAAAYLPDDDDLRVEAAAAVATAGLELIDAFRLNDGVQLMQRAIELGYREPRRLLRLARALNEQQRVEELWEVLELIPDDPDHPALAAEKIHIGAVALTFRDPAEALPGLEEAARRWSALGETAKYGWALANQGVALFFLGRNHESDASLRESLSVFSDAGERDGQMAAYRFLALVCPDDPHAHEWVTESLQRAEEVGDRTAQVNSYNTLSWHHFMRSRLGGTDDTAELRYYLDRLLETARRPRHARARDPWARDGRQPGSPAGTRPTTPAGSRPRPCRSRSPSPVHRARPDGRVLVRPRARRSLPRPPRSTTRSVDPVSLMCRVPDRRGAHPRGPAPTASPGRWTAVGRRPGQTALEGLIAGFGTALALIVARSPRRGPLDAEWVDLGRHRAPRAARRSRGPGPAGRGGARRRW